MFASRTRLERLGGPDSPILGVPHCLRATRIVVTALGTSANESPKWGSSRHRHLFDSAET